MLTVLDEYTCQALCVSVATKMGHAEVLDTLYPLFLKYVNPEYLRSHNGPDFIAGDLQTWLKKAGIKPI
jgi:transposase InsO family protein